VFNEAERLVLDELERQLAQAPPSVPRSEECVLDMACYALNLVKPMYRVNLLGRLYADALMRDNAGEIRDAVSRAINQISHNPPS
jgi:hypothetical protein